MTRRLTSLAFTLPLLLCSGCVLWENPIAPPEDAEYDERLTGVWMLVDEQGNQEDPEGFPPLLHFGRAGEDAPENFLELMGIGHNDDGTLMPVAMLAYTAQVGEAWYITCTYEGFFQPLPATWNDQPSYYCVGRYEIVDNELLIYGVGGEGFKSALADGELMGSDYQPGGPFATLSSPTAALQEYIAAGHDLFVERPFMRLRRVE